MNAIPVANGIIYLLTGEETSDAGIVYNLGTPSGVVVAVGPGAHNLTDGSRLEMEVRVGDVIQVAPNHSHPLLNNEPYAVTNEEFVVSILSREPTSAGSRKTAASPRKRTGKRSK